MTADNYQYYRKKGAVLMRPFEAGETIGEHVSISQADRDAGSPKVGDMIARNPDDAFDEWLVAQAYYEKNYEPVW